jgi:hypothetical protein
MPPPSGVNRPWAAPAPATGRADLAARLADAADTPDGDRRMATLRRVAADAEAAGDTTVARAARLAVLDGLHRRVGRVDEAAQAHLTAYRRHRTDRGGAAYLAHHLLFCVLTGQYQRGLDILAGQPGRHRPVDGLAAMEYAAAGAAVCRLAERAGLGGRPLFGPTVGAVGARLAATATGSALRFDRRNGTGHQGRRAAAWLAARPSGAPVPLPRTAEEPAGADEPATELVAAGALRPPRPWARSSAGGGTCR